MTFLYFCGMRKLREKIFVVIFGTDTRAGRNFDVFLLWLIVISVFLVMMATVKSLMLRYGVFFKSAELFFTFVFTLEYLLRIFSHPDPRKYIFSFYGIIDFLAIVVWHFYFVIFNPDIYPMSLAWFKGTITEEEMAEEHPLELKRIKEQEKLDSNSED